MKAALRASSLSLSILCMAWPLLPVQAETTANRDVVGNPFAKKSWRPPAVKKHEAPRQPEAPPLEYTYFGRFIDEKGNLMIFVQKSGGRVFLVTQGSTFDTHYRVESIQGDLINLRYLPLNVMQTLRMNGGAF